MICYDWLNLVRLISSFLTKSSKIISFIFAVTFPMKLIKFYLGVDFYTKLVYEFFWCDALTVSLIECCLFKSGNCWSLDEVVGDLRIRVRPCVRPSVRHAVARKPFITFF